MPSANALNLRKLREEAKRDGRCSTCRARDAKPGRLTCQHCIDSVAANKVRAREQGKCVRCWRPSPTGTAHCRACATIHMERTKTAKIAAGKCLRCKWPALRVGGLCAVHTEANRAKQEEILDATRPNRTRRGHLPYTCRGCGERGHNVRTCTAVAA